jgi:DNA-binding MarR family transcriptional regulator
MAASFGAKLPVPTDNKPHAALVSVWWTGLMLKKAADRFFRPFGSSEAQFNILWLLKYADGPLTQRDISERLVVDKSNITGLIDRMGKAGLVARHPVAGDRRSYHVQMTARGRKLMDRMDPAYDRRVQEVIGGLTAAEQDELLRLTEKVREGLGEVD